MKLKAPLGFNNTNLRVMMSPKGVRKLILKQIYCMNIVSHDGFVFFPEVLWSLMNLQYGVNNFSIPKNKMVLRVVNIVRSRFVFYEKIPVSYETLTGNFNTESIEVTEGSLTAYQYLLLINVQMRWK